jgi:hypothetical protein
MFLSCPWLAHRKLESWTIGIFACRDISHYILLGAVLHSYRGSILRVPAITLQILDLYGSDNYLRRIVAMVVFNFVFYFNIVAVEVVILRIYAKGLYL